MRAAVVASSQLRHHSFSAIWVQLLCPDSLLDVMALLPMRMAPNSSPVQPATTEATIYTLLHQVDNKIVSLLL